MDPQADISFKSSELTKLYNEMVDRRREGLPKVKCPLTIKRCKNYFIYSTPANTYISHTEFQGGGAEATQLLDISVLYIFTFSRQNKHSSIFGPKYETPKTFPSGNTTEFCSRTCEHQLHVKAFPSMQIFLSPKFTRYCG